MFLGCQGFWINQWLQIPGNMNLSTYNKGRKGNVFRTCVLFIYLLQNADSAPKIGCLLLGADKPQKTCPWGGPDWQIFFTRDMSTFLQGGAHGCIYFSCWSPGPQKFSNPCFQTCTPLGGFFVPSFFFLGKYFLSKGFSLNSYKWTSGESRTRNNSCIFNGQSRVAQEIHHPWME